MRNLVIKYLAFLQKKRDKQYFLNNFQIPNPNLKLIKMF